METKNTSQFIAGNAVQFNDCGLLILGPSGSGKSDLTLRLVDAGGMLIADDNILILRKENSLHAQCPPKTQGLIEIRGIGILRISSQASTTLDAVIVLKQHSERLPIERTWDFLGINLPQYTLNAQKHSAVAIVRHLCHLIQGQAQILPQNKVLTHEGIA